jgi:hypothetical protein
MHFRDAVLIEQEYARTRCSVRDLTNALAVEFPLVPVVPMPNTYVRRAVVQRIGAVALCSLHLPKRDLTNVLLHLGATPPYACSKFQSRYWLVQVDDLRWRSRPFEASLMTES